MQVKSCCRLAAVPPRSPWVAIALTAVLEVLLLAADSLLERHVPQHICL